MLLTSAMLAGCGSGLAQVTGQVTLDGRPLQGGAGDTRVTVEFHPASGVGSVSIGLADESGKYTLGTGAQTGIPPGEYRVSCSASRLVPGGGARRITDPKFANTKTSGLTCSVAPGSNEFNIAVTSPPAGRRGP
ncbi:MAG: hypothetical protein AB7G28_13365 [Pirellulales bacterium]